MPPVRGSQSSSEQRSTLLRRRTAWLHGTAKEAQDAAETYNKQLTDIVASVHLSANLATPTTRVLMKKLNVPLLDRLSKKGNAVGVIRTMAHEITNGDDSHPETPTTSASAGTSTEGAGKKSSSEELRTINREKKRRSREKQRRAGISDVDLRRKYKTLRQLVDEEDFWAETDTASVRNRLITILDA